MEPRVVLTSLPILLHTNKDRIPITETSNMIYHFKCCCESSYVGQTSRRLGERIKEHVPKCVVDYLESNLDDYTKTQKLRNAASRSAIAEHLLNNKSCGAAYSMSSFTVLRKCRTKMELRAGLRSAGV